MKDTVKVLKLPAILLVIIFSFIACDKDFSEINSDVLGLGNSNFKINTLTVPVIAYNKKLEPIQSNGLDSYILGFYKDTFGTTTASIVTQLTASTYPDDFRYNPNITSVILSIPYFSTVNGSDYILDSLYGSDPIKLSIYKNNYFLRSFDPELEGAQKYYTNDEATFYPVTSPSNIGELLYQNEAFTFSEAAVIGDIEEEFLSPRLRVDLTEGDFWKDTFLANKDSRVLSNDIEFNNFFRGLYIKAEAISGKGSLVLLDLSRANITINFTKQDVIYDDVDSDGIPDFADADLDGDNLEDIVGTDTNNNGIIDDVEGEGDDDLNLDSIDDNYKKVEDTYILNFTETSVNLLTNEYPLLETLIPQPTGDEKLYLKGAEGSMAIVDLFEDKTALTNFINEYRISDENGSFLENDDTGNYLLSKLVNDVQLVIYEDETLFNDASHKGDRIYAYDINNNTTTTDYLLDPTSNLQNPYFSKTVSLGQRIEDDNGTNYKYKIRLTEHIKNLLLSLNIDNIEEIAIPKIGLTLSSNVNYTSNSKILNSGDDVSEIPSSALLTPRGTILYGSDVSDPNKKMKLEVYFTEPK